MINMCINLTISTYLPRPLCSIDEKLTTASNIFSSWSKWLAKKLFLSWFGLMTVILGWRLWICVYSSVVIWFAPFSNNIASSHGDNEPITNTFPCFTFIIHLYISFTLRRYFLNFLDLQISRVNPIFTYVIQHMIIDVSGYWHDFMISITTHQFSVSKQCPKVINLFRCPCLIPRQR